MQNSYFLTITALVAAKELKQNFGRSISQGLKSKFYGVVPT